MEKFSTKNYISYNGEDYSNYFVVYCRSYNSSSILEEANIKVIIKEFKEHNFEFLDIDINNWLVGKCQYILVDSENKESVQLASELIDQLDNYPILDEFFYSDLQQEYINNLSKLDLKYYKKEAKEKGISLEEYLYDLFV